MYKKSYLLAGLWILLLFSCTPRKLYYEENGTVFHTYYRIQYEASSVLTEKIDAELESLDLSLNPFNPLSTIGQVNANEPVKVDEWFIDVFNKSKEIAEASGGVFDVTAAPLINLWGFGFNKTDHITPQMIDSIKTFVGYEKVRLEGRTVVKDDPRILLNFSAIAKGYACDVIARLLEREGVQNYMIDIGGETVMNGLNPHGNCWRIGINKPQEDPLGVKREVEEVIQPCKKCGIATSGDYRNFYIKDGKKYAHTIDPRTGYPAGQSMLSATIVAEDCMTADGFATAFMAMGVEKAIEMAKKIPAIEYFIIYADEAGEQKTIYSPGLLPNLPNRQALGVLENP
ncbi:FAD:protein FMN transferase [Parabacteroides sp. 52]|uniref:FAD:protein FMN transferase n=1 Tax=unclassified Parabacteroides TaxID=2649774 RepID=UPI0013D5B211|nr:MULTISPECIES: FAD:protein FMN transferase [unclassified Parabacteroides]MDH6533665.1 thiamine biosynthesis lipoprotein [Parabacteroides sp. PM5-20]NDV54417.1 FAD:protein FMN transferase [Parabacteroides sp. 52]